MEKSFMTQKTRLKVWRAVRREIKKRVELSKDPNSMDQVNLWGEGLCHFLRDETCKVKRIHDYFPIWQMHESNWFPELTNYKPDGLRSSDYWWPLDLEGYQARLEVCNEIIKKLEYKK